MVIILNLIKDWSPFMMAHWVVIQLLLKYLQCWVERLLYNLYTCLIQLPNARVALKGKSGASYRSKSMKSVYESKFSKEEFLELYHESLFPEYKSKDKVVWVIDNNADSQTQGWEKQFLGRLIRSQGAMRRRKGPRTLKEEIGGWNSQGGGKDNFFFLHSLVRII